jgi:hypothetical protein
VLAPISSASLCELFERKAARPLSSFPKDNSQRRKFMNLRKCLSTILFAMLFLGLVAGGGNVLAQSSTAAAADGQSERAEKDDDVNLDTQLYLLVATNQEVPDTKLPAALDSLVKQLRSALPFKNYRLAATLINRVKNNGRLNLKWIGGPLGVTAEPSINPSFNEFKVNTVRIANGAGGQVMVRMEGFGYGARIPIQTGPSAAVASNAPSPAVFNYESTGLNTDISMREGEPVVVGTLHVGPSGDAIILVISAKRSDGGGKK